MLPFLKPKQMASTIIMNSKDERKDGSAPEHLVKLAEKLISAVHAKDSSEVAACLHELGAEDEKE